jgi:hypothetical protein
MIRDPGLLGGYKRIIAQKPHLRKAENTAWSAAYWSGGTGS